MRPLVLAGALAVLPACAAAEPVVSASDLARGVELRREGRPAEAVPFLEAATQAHPQDADAWLNLGLAYAMSNRLDAAEAALDQAARLAPAYADVQIARARVAYFRQDPVEAQRRLGPVLAAHPDNAEARGLAEQIAVARQAGASPWRWDASYTRGRLSRGLPPVKTWTGAVTRRFSDGRFAGASLDHTRQFGRTDTYGELLAGTHRAYLALGGAPGADFRPQWAVRGGVYGDAWRHSRWTIQPLVDASWARYRVGDVRILTPGLELASGERLYVRLRWINVVDEHDAYRAGYSVFGQWRLPRGPLGVSGGYADAPESSEGATQRVRTVSGGVLVDLGARTTVRLIAAEEKRPTYRRHDLTVALTQRF